MTLKYVVQHISQFFLDGILGLHLGHTQLKFHLDTGQWSFFYIFSLKKHSKTMITTRERVRFGHKPLPHFVRPTERLSKLEPPTGSNNDAVPMDINAMAAGEMEAIGFSHANWQKEARD
jgi:hypothetical protein